MMNITIIQVGKTKHSFLQEAENEYKKRLSAYGNINIITVKDTKIAKQINEKKKIIEEEGSRICEKIPKDNIVIVLDEKGKQFTSVQFSEYIGDNLDKGIGNITFIIGGCYGLSHSVIEKAAFTLSFSKFTFTHEMVRSLLLEQLYRAFTLIKGKSYHY